MAETVPLTIACAGCGSRGHEYLSRMADRPDRFRITALADPVLSRREGIALLIEGEVREFEDADTRAAHNFRVAAEKRGVRRIIYLGGLGDTATDLSTHLASRSMVAEEFAKGHVPVTILRAAIIIGSGLLIWWREGNRRSARAK